MALATMIFRKMVKNRWLQLGLLLGLTIAVILVSSMPVYTNAILQRMLIKDLELTQQEKNSYPGIVKAEVDLEKDMPQEDGAGRIATAEKYLLDHAADYSIPLQYFVQEKATFYYSLKPADPQKVAASQSRGATITALSDLEQHVQLIDGRLPSAELVDGVYEAIVTDSTIFQQKLALGNEFIVTDDYLNKSIRLKVVGVFDIENGSDLYWTSNEDITNKMFINYSLFEKELIGSQKWQGLKAKWTLVMDYSQMKLDRMNNFSKTFDSTDQYLSGLFQTNYSKVKLETSAIETLKNYDLKKQKLYILLWSLYVPMLVLLGFYLFMVEHLMINRQKNEISVLRSRGSSRLQIIIGYIAESLVLGCVALLIGPPLSLVLTKILGASNGFLEFVHRAPLEVHLTDQTYMYALATIAGSVIITLIPAIKATRKSIVGHKQSLARSQIQSFAHKYFIDVILISISIYGIYNFNRRMTHLRSLGLDSLDFSVDPLLFIIPSMFIIGGGLFILRIYPWLIRIIFQAGKKWWSPAAYASLIQVSRSYVNYLFVMVFLVITIATGLFGISAARTINENMEEQIRYHIGADMVLTTPWKSDTHLFDDDPQSESKQKSIHYMEPSFLAFSELNGIEHAAKVFKKENANIRLGNNQENNITLMGVEPESFGNTAWLRDGVMDYHFYDYLNLLAMDPSSVLISKTLASKMQLKPGDQISMAWDESNYGKFYVFAIIDYWPSWNPNPDASSDPMLVVGNLPYIQKNLALAPYEIWFKLKPESTSQQIYNELKEQNIQITSLTDEKQEIIKSKVDPFRLAINGVMTLGFVLAILICFFGFLLYWILTLSGRVLQFGIFRAMGMSLGQVIGLLVFEQLLTSGAAIIIGVITGLLSSRLFVPFFQISFDPVKQALPFRVIVEVADQLRLYTIVMAMIAASLLILGLLISRIRIHQAIKLGED